MRPDYCPIGGEPCQSVCAEPCSVAKKATPHETLIAQLMDSRVLKTEREHAAAREIERLRGAAPEPAAWINFNAATGERSVSFKSESELASIPLWREPPRAQRKPLTEEEILNIIDDVLEGGSLVDVARAIERAHEIGGQDESA